DVLTGLAGDDFLFGRTGADLLSGGDGNDHIQGDRGDDTLIGGAGNDTYVFNLGDGVDSIQDIAVPGEGNVIQFGSDISLVDLDLAREQNTLTITFGAFGDAIRLTDFDPSNVNGS